MGPSLSPSFHFTAGPLQNVGSQEELPDPAHKKVYAVYAVLWDSLVESFFTLDYQPVYFLVKTIHSKE